MTSDAPFRSQAIRTASWPAPLGWALILGTTAAVAHLGPPAERIPLVVGAWCLGGAVWLGLWAREARRPSSGSLWPWILGAILLRIVVLAGDPGLSDDVYRYAWEGGLAAEGVSPFAHAPNAPELEPFRTRWPVVFAGLNNQDVSAAYPPVTQAACTLVVWAAGGPERALLPLRAFFALCDLLVLVPLLALARARARTRARTVRTPTRTPTRAPTTHAAGERAIVIAWGWCPLVVLEFAGSGHFDSLGILALLGALAWLTRASEASSPARRAGREGLGLALLSAAILTKYLPLAALPFAVRGPRWGRRVAFVVALVALAFVPVLLLEGGALGLGSGLSEYGLRWEAGSLVYRFVEPLYAAAFERDGTWTDPRKLGRATIGLVWLACGALLWLRRREPVRATGAWIGAFLILSPTLHPWYATWVLPFVALAPSLAWGVLVALLPVLYWPLAGWAERGEWVEPTWSWPLLALPFFALLALESFGGKRPLGEPRRGDEGRIAT